MRQDQSQTYFRVGGLITSLASKNGATRMGNGGALGHAPQEIWFSVTPPYEMITPDSLKTLPTLTTFDEAYASAFFRDNGSSSRLIDCGGLNMEDIKDNNGFTFAHNL